MVRLFKFLRQVNAAALMHSDSVTKITAAVVALIQLHCQMFKGALKLTKSVYGQMHLNCRKDFANTKRSALGRVGRQKNRS